ncbi:hypothetical protein EDD68_13515 [Melghiribacillus thermohalophilus]|uniref:Uncharacterized protein n=1 Tax=Melghiribacillus thermohalophilus TaxID=1324956 RepID=A0A4R3MNY6_9BACI|nr:hypothetical protein EDD68_13515 [Melghiribacillus thermohalophilus]
MSLTVIRYIINPTPNITRMIPVAIIISTIYISSFPMALFIPVHIYGTK